MKIALILMMLLSSSFGLEEDKQKHIGATAGIALVTSIIVSQYDYTPTEVFWISLGTALAVGLAKELTDDEFSSGDLAADALGGTLGAIPMFVIYRW